MSELGFPQVVNKKILSETEIVVRFLVQRIGLWHTQHFPTTSFPLIEGDAEWGCVTYTWAFGLGIGWIQFPMDERDALSR